MVQLRNLDPDIFRVHVRLRKQTQPQFQHFAHPFQAQLIPQLIINYKLKARGTLRCQRESHLTSPRGIERCTYADEGDDLQDAVYRS